MDTKKYTSVFLKATDLPDGIVVAEIKSVRKVPLSSDGSPPRPKFVVDFSGGKLPPLVLNVTNLRTLQSDVGYDTDQWVGRSVQLEKIKTQFQGRVCDGTQLSVLPVVKPTRSSQPLGGAARSMTKFKYYDQPPGEAALAPKFEDKQGGAARSMAKYKYYDLVLRVRNDAITTVTELVKDFEIVMLTPSGGQNYQPSPQRNRTNGIRRHHVKGYTGCQLLLDTLRASEKGVLSMRHLIKAFRANGFSDNSVQPRVSALVREGKVRKLKTGKVELVSKGGSPPSPFSIGEKSPSPSLST